MDDAKRERWRRADTLFTELVELDPAARSERLAKIGTTDPELRSAVEALLEGDAIADARLPAPGLGLAPPADSAGPADRAGRGDPLRLVGRAVSRFTVQEHLASGGMGVVYRADDPGLGRSIALKFPLPYHRPEKATTERFLREARAAGALDHPNLCPVYEIGESPAGLFFAMPLYRGETLKERLARGGPLPIREALTIAEQVAAGLEHAHAAGITHRDIKPANIMLLPDGTVKVLDFGLARARNLGEGISYGVLGTVGYLAPEQIRREPGGPAVDLWAVGAILYEMIGGIRPFAGEHEAAVLHAILHDHPVSLTLIRPDLPAGLDPLVHSLLIKAPASRPTAAELSGALRSFRRGELPGTRRRPLIVRRGGLIGTFVLGLAVAAWTLTRDRSLIGSGALTGHDRVVVADFEVPGPDTTRLGPLLTRALRQYLGTSRVISLVPQVQIDSVLTRMRHPSSGPFDVETAREVAQREGASAVVTGGLAPLGDGYLVTLRLLAAGDGIELASFQTTVPTLETDLLPALGRLGGALRGKIGESLRDVRAQPPLRRLTTRSLEALRLYHASGGGRSANMARLRAAVALDNTFAYAWFGIGNNLTNLRYRTAAQDSAFTMMYRFRDGLTGFEPAQIAAVYFKNVRMDRRRAMDAYSVRLAQDSLDRLAILNGGELLVETRQFGRAEALLERGMRSDSISWDVLRPLVQAKVGLGRLAEADSLVAEYLGIYGANRARVTRVLLSQATFRFDSVVALASFPWPVENPSPDMMSSVLAGIARLRGQLALAHQHNARADSLNAELMRQVGVTFDPAISQALPAASEEIWLLGKPGPAFRRLDTVLARRPLQSLSEVQDRIDAVRAAALYAAAGRPDRARAILQVIDQIADTLTRLAVFPLRHRTLGEIALAEGRPREAMQWFRKSDEAADGFPATKCEVCILPALARAADQAGWTDSAQTFWERYAETPSLDRLETDQWFLARAYGRLSALYLAAGHAAKASEFSAKRRELLKAAEQGFPTGMPATP